MQTADATGQASAIANYDQSNPSPWADLSAAQAAALSAQLTSQANALLTQTDALADAQKIFEQAQADALETKDNADATAEDNQALTDAQSTHDEETAQAAATDAVFSYLPYTLIAPTDGPAPVLTPDFQQLYEANDFVLQQYAGNFWQTGQFLGGGNKWTTAPGFMPDDLSFSEYGYDWGGYAGGMLFGLLGLDPGWTPSESDFSGANSIIDGTGAAYGNPAPFKLQDILRVNSLPLAAVFGPALHITGTSGALLDLSNTPSAVGPGGYAQSPLPTTTAGTQPAAGGGQSSSPSASLMNVPAQSQAMKAQQAGAPAGGPQSGPKPAAPQNGGTTAENPANNDSATIEDSSPSNTDATQGTTIIVVVVVVQPDAARSPSQLRFRSAGEPNILSLAGNAGSTSPPGATPRLVLADPDKEAETPISGAPSGDASAGGGQGKAASGDNAHTASPDGAMVVIVAVAGRPTKADFSNPQSPYFDPRTLTDPNLREQYGLPPTPGPLERLLMDADHAAEMSRGLSVPPPVKESSEDLAMAQAPELTAREEQLIRQFDEAKAADKKELMTRIAMIWGQEHGGVPPFISEAELWGPILRAKFATRMAGVGRAVGGAVEMVEGGLLFVVQPELGVILIAHGADNAYAGVVMTSSGKYTQSWTEEKLTDAASAAGFNSADAAALGALGDMAVPVVVSGVSGLRSASAARSGALAELRGTGPVGSPRLTAIENARARPVMQLTVLDPEFVPNAERVLQNLTNQVNQRFAATLPLANTVLSEEELIAAGSSRGLARMQYGNALERLVAKEIEKDATLSILFEHIGGAGQPDFIGHGLFAGKNFDITTEAQIAAHRARPGYGKDLIIVIYERPPGFP